MRCLAVIGPPTASWRSSSRRPTRQPLAAGLTIPVIAAASIWLEGPLVLGLGATQIVLLAVTVVVATLTVVPGRATRLQGVIHLVLLAGFLFLAVNPELNSAPVATVARVQLTVVDHPLARARLSRMRDERTDNANFRAALRDLTQMLMYEATRDLKLAEETIRTPVRETTGYEIAEPPLIVPVLRAGLGMADTAHRMLPESQMGFVGLARNEETFQPEAYMASLPASLVGREVFVLDPMLATGGSLLHCCGLLTDRGATSITVLCALAAPEGLRRLEESGLPLRIFTASVDEGLNPKAYIVPGLGDAGDRQFGAV